MRLYDIKNKKSANTAEALSEFSECGRLFVMCKTNEIHALKDIFGFDESTVAECTNLDESVRYASFDGYDFISVVHLEQQNKMLALREINLYISQKYLVLVMPEHESPRLTKLENEIMAAAKIAGEEQSAIIKLYFMLFNKFLLDFSEVLEDIEDEIEALSEAVIKNVDAIQLTDINRLHKITYTAKKQLRSLSYIGEQMLVDENGIIGKNGNRYFRSIDTRLKKLYDFSASLYELSSATLYTYDSKISAKTNDIVTRLTLITLFFAPLTLITGIYGMNFIHMPELAKPYAYPIVLAIMAAIVTGLYIFAKRKKLL